MMNEKKEKKKRPAGKGGGHTFRIIVYITAIVLIFLAINPGLFPFLPEKALEVWYGLVSGMYGSSGQAFVFNWLALLQLAVVIGLLILVRQVVRSLLARWEPDTKRGKTLSHLLRSSVRYLLVIIGIFWGLTILGVNVGTLFAGAGILALIIGFGAESLIADVITGLFMIFENQYNVGDIVELDGYRGTVVNIAVRTTSIEDAGGNVKIFNNSDMRNIINLSSDSSRAICDIPIPYEADLDRAEEIIARLSRELAREEPDIFPEVPEYLGVQQLADSAVLLRITAVVSEEHRFAAARRLNRKMKIGLEKEGMGAPYAQLVVHKAE